MQDLSQDSVFAMLDAASTTAVSVANLLDDVRTSAITAEERGTGFDAAQAMTQIAQITMVSAEWSCAAVRLCCKSQHHTAVHGKASAALV
jgi:hypothetical protein